MVFIFLAVKKWLFRFCSGKHIHNIERNNWHVEAEKMGLCVICCMVCACAGDCAILWKKFQRMQRKWDEKRKLHISSALIEFIFRYRYDHLLYVLCVCVCWRVTVVLSRSQYCQSLFMTAFFYLTKTETRLNSALTDREKKNHRKAPPIERPIRKSCINSTVKFANGFFSIVDVVSVVALLFDQLSVFHAPRWCRAVWEKAEHVYFSSHWNTLLWVCACGSCKLIHTLFIGKTVFCLSYFLRVKHIRRYNFLLLLSRTPATSTRTSTNGWALCTIRCVCTFYHNISNSI